MSLTAGGGLSQGVIQALPDGWRLRPLPASLCSAAVLPGTGAPALHMHAPSHLERLPTSSVSAQNDLSGLSFGAASSRKPPPIPWLGPSGHHVALHRSSGHTG